MCQGAMGEKWLCDWWQLQWFLFHSVFLLVVPVSKKLFPVAALPVVSSPFCGFFAGDKRDINFIYHWNKGTSTTRVVERAFQIKKSGIVCCGIVNALKAFLFWWNINKLSENSIPSQQFFFFYCQTASEIFHYTPFGKIPMKYIFFSSFKHHKALSFFVTAIL